MISASLKRSSLPYLQLYRFRSMSNLAVKRSSLPYLQLYRFRSMSNLAVGWSSLPYLQLYRFRSMSNLAVKRSSLPYLQLCRFRSMSNLAVKLPSLPYLQLYRFRSMSNLAARFVDPQTSTSTIHVVDPDFDLHDRFLDCGHLQRMLQLRGRNGDQLEQLSKDYDRWWNLYCQYDGLKSSGNIQAAGQLKRQLYGMSDVLIECLRLPNDLDGDVLPGKRPIRMPSIDHMRHSKMIKQKEDNNLLYLVGKPVLLQRRLQELFSKAWSKQLKSLTVSPHHMIRPAIVEATGLETINFIDVFENDHTPPMLLVGHGLQSMMALFIKSMFRRSGNPWPIRFHSSGTSYRPTAMNKSLFDCKQFIKFSAIDFCLDEESCRRQLAIDRETLNNMLEQFGLDLTIDAELAGDLQPFERLAITWRRRTGGEEELARIGHLGSFVSRRLNVTVGDDEPLKKAQYVYQNYAEVNVTGIVAALIEAYCNDEHMDNWRGLPKIFE